MDSGSWVQCAKFLFGGILTPGPNLGSAPLPRGEGETQAAAWINLRLNWPGTHPQNVITRVFELEQKLTKITKGLIPFVAKAGPPGVGQPWAE